LTREQNKVNNLEETIKTTEKSHSQKKEKETCSKIRPYLRGPGRKIEPVLIPQETIKSMPDLRKETLDLEIDNPKVEKMDIKEVEKTDIKETCQRIRSYDFPSKTKSKDPPKRKRDQEIYTPFKKKENF